MKPLNTKLVLSALGIVAMLTSPALAKTSHQPSPQQQTTQAPVGLYPEATAGMPRTGSLSNQFEHDHGYYPFDSRS